MCICGDSLLRWVRNLWLLLRVRQRERPIKMETNQLRRNEVLHAGARKNPFLNLFPLLTARRIYSRRNVLFMQRTIPFFTRYTYLTSVQKLNTRASQLVKTLSAIISHE